MVHAPFPSKRRFTDVFLKQPVATWHRGNKSWHGRTKIKVVNNKQEAQQNFPGSFNTRLSHSGKSCLSLVSSAASWTWWNGFLKSSQRSRHFKGVLEPTPQPCITPGVGREKRVKEKWRENGRDSERGGENCKTEMQNSYCGWDERRERNLKWKSAESKSKKEKKKKKTTSNS